MNINDNELIGKRIRHLRQMRGWKQSVFAEKIGISQPDVSRIETGRISCMYNIYHIVHVLEIEIDDLISGIEDPKLKSELEFAYKRESVKIQPQNPQQSLPELIELKNSCSDIKLIITNLWNKTKEQKIVIRENALKLLVNAFTEQDPDLAQKQLNAVAALLS